MSEKFCRNCILAIPVKQGQESKQVTVEVSINGRLVTEKETSDLRLARTIFIRNCKKSQGLPTTEGYDGCVSKLEYTSN